MSVVLNLFLLLCKPRLMLLIVFGAQVSLTHAQTEVIFTVNAPGAAPFLYFDQTKQEYAGVVVDFFETMEKNGVVDVRYVEAIRARSEQLVYDGRADIFLSSPAWLSAPDKILTSEPLSMSKTFLYSSTPFASDFSVDKLENERICTRRGYVYPGLANYFILPERRVDSASQKTGMSMMLKGRCDYVAMNYFNAVSLVNNEFCDTLIHQSPAPTNVVPNAFILSKSLVSMVPTINHYLQEFQSNGDADKAFDTHSFNTGVTCSSTLSRK